MNKLILASALLLSSTQANAWGNLGLPDPVTWVIHGVGGYAIAAILDSYEAKESTGMGVATLVGVVKEVSDTNFSVADAISWTVGAKLYYLGKEKGWKWQYDSDYQQQYWYLPLNETK